jgi:hypothetical protein
MEKAQNEVVDYRSRTVHLTLEKGLILGLRDSKSRRDSSLQNQSRLVASIAMCAGC